MLRLIRTCGVLLGLTVMLSGCSSHEDRLIQQKIALMVEISTIYEKVNDKQSFADAQAQVETLLPKLRDVDDKILKLPEEARVVAMDHNAKAYVEATARFKSAREVASKNAK